MLTKLYCDDLRAAGKFYLPPAILFTVICWASAFISGADLESSAFFTVYRISEILLFLSVPIPTICRSYSQRLGRGAQMWLAFPIKAPTRVISKILCTASFFAVSLSSALAGRALYCFRRPNENYSAFFSIQLGGGFSDNAAELFFNAFLFLTVCLCIQQIAEISMTQAMKRRRVAVNGFWIFAALLLVLVVIYEVGNYLVGELFRFLGETAVRNLYYSYSCAFFAVMTVVFVIINSVQLKKAVRL